MKKESKHLRHYGIIFHAKTSSTGYEFYIFPEYLPFLGILVSHLLKLYLLTWA